MAKQLLFFLLIFYSAATCSQQNVVVFKKKNNIIQQFWIGSFFAFQLADKKWRKGRLTRIENDSFYIRPMVVHYSMFGADTTWYDVQPFVLADVYAMPRRELLIDYKDGRFQISRSGGHMHWYWIKSGLLFRLAGAGYAALNTTNGLIHNNFSFSGSKLGIAAAVFVFGVLLKHIYSVVLPINHKYHLEVISLKP